MKKTLTVLIMLIFGFLFLNGQPKSFIKIKPGESIYGLSFEESSLNDVKKKLGKSFKKRSLGNIYCGGKKSYYFRHEIYYKKLGMKFLFDMDEGFTTNKKQVKNLFAIECNVNSNTRLNESDWINKLKTFEVLEKYGTPELSYDRFSLSLDLNYYEKGIIFRIKLPEDFFSGFEDPDFKNILSEKEYDVYSILICKPQDK